MKAEQDRWRLLRAQAEGCLPPDFARRVVARVQSCPQLRRQEYLLIAITAGVCLIAVPLLNWYIGNRIQQRNLSLWKTAHAQIRALKTSI